MSLGSWTDERVRSLKQLWADGLSGSQVAATLGGVTRNAVIGKLSRLGCDRTMQKPKAAPRKPRPTRRVLVRPGRQGSYGGEVQVVEYPATIDLPADFSADACTLMELKPESCRWPIGDPSTEAFRYCGTVHDGTYGSYCLGHARIAYQPAAPRPVSTWNTR